MTYSLHIGKRILSILLSLIIILSMTLCSSLTSKAYQDGDDFYLPIKVWPAFDTTDFLKIAYVYQYDEVSEECVIYLDENNVPTNQTNGVSYLGHVTTNLTNNAGDDVAGVKGVLKADSTNCEPGTITCLAIDSSNHLQLPQGAVLDGNKVILDEDSFSDMYYGSQHTDKFAQSFTSLTETTTKADLKNRGSIDFVIPEGSTFSTPRSALAGETVLFNFTEPDDDSRILSDFRVVDAKTGNTVDYPVKTGNGNEYSFTMPKGDVVIKASFERCKADSYWADGNTLYASLNSASKMTISGNELSLSLSSESCKYTGEPVYATFNTYEYKIWQKALGLSFTPAVHYVGIDGTEYEDTLDAPTAPGKYRAYISPCGVKARASNTAYTEFEIEDVVCTFVTNGDAPGAIYGIAAGSKLKNPEIAPESGKILYGWFKDEEYKEKWDFDNDTVNDSITLYGIWFKPVDEITLNESPDKPLYEHDVKYTSSIDRTPLQYSIATAVDLNGDPYPIEGKTYTRVITITASPEYGWTDPSIILNNEEYSDADIEIVGPSKIVIKKEVVAEKCNHESFRYVTVKGSLLKNGYTSKYCERCGQLLEVVQNNDGYGPNTIKSASVLAKSKGFKVSWTKRTGTSYNQTTGYIIKYSTSKNMTNAKTVTRSKASSSCTVSNLKAKKKYYITITPVAETADGAFYGNTKTLTITTKK